MSVFPLAQFEADLEADRIEAARNKGPETVVARFGVMKLIGEFPYTDEQRPGCGSKLVVRTHRGMEFAEALTSVCQNAGCSKSITRKEMLDFIDRSGGRDYPFATQKHAARLASVEDMNRQATLVASRRELVRTARQEVAELDLPMKIVEAEQILGGERLTFYFMAEERVDFRELVRRLAAEHKTRIELVQIGARDEARLTGDYERCGQHCCCKQFLKVLKPVSMRSAKTQKATLDPLKISGRCGRLMCCLRYEDQSYEELKRLLPRRGTRVGTPEGPGTVIGVQILTQLVQVALEEAPGRIAVPVEELCDPDAPRPVPEPAPVVAEAAVEEAPKQSSKKRRRRGRRKKKSAQGADGSTSQDGPAAQQRSSPRADEGASAQDSSSKKRRRRRRRGRGGRKPKGGGESGPGGAGGDGGGSGA